MFEKLDQKLDLVDVFDSSKELVREFIEPGVAFQGIQGDFNDRRRKIK